MTRVTCWIHPEHVFYHTARWLSGLWSLHRTREISLRILPAPQGSRFFAWTTPVVPFEIERDGKLRLAIADFRDPSDRFVTEALKQCDVYFKRSYYAPDLPAGGDASKVRPLGMNYTCQTSGSAGAIFRAIAPGLILSPRRFFPWLQNQIRCLTVVPPREAFERAPGDPAQQAVIFQSRLWEGDDIGEAAAAEINQKRVAIIRMLREAFGSRFHGGLVPTPLAKRQFPDLLAGQTSRKNSYIKLARSHLIGIYTAGLHHSTAWKLAEYIAASQCIVGERPRNAAPKELIEGTNYLPFSAPGECVTACRKILGDENLAKSMRQANHNYYSTELTPEVWVRNRLNEAMETR